MLSFWEKKSFTEYDIAIIGSGITGLSTAIELKAKRPNARIIVLEKGVLPTGASTKNAGFACVGSLTEIMDDLNHLSPQEVFNLVEMRHKGLLLLRDRLGDKAIDYQELGSYELCFNEDNYFPKIEMVNDLLFPIFKRDVFSMSNKKFGFSPSVKNMIESSVEGQIDTGKMMISLLELARENGIEVKTGYCVDSIQSNGDCIEITHYALPLKAKQVCVCTNAFSKSLVQDINLSPGRGQVLITQSIPNLPFKGVFHFSEGYYYFRTIGNRVLFGGGRQLDFKTETTTSFSINNSIQKDLEDKLRHIILPNTKFNIEQRWSGIMAFGETKEPIVEQIEPGIFAAVRLGGMGIAIGSKVGELLANLVLEHT